MIIAETTAGAASAAVSAAGAVAAPMDLLELLIIGAVLGMFGQGTRAVIGLKGMSDDARAQGLSFNDLFEAARLLTSLLIGGLVGLASALVFYKANGAVTPDATTCLAWAAAGYAGTDALEGFISQYFSPAVTRPQSKSAAGPNTGPQLKGNKSSTRANGGATLDATQSQHSDITSSTGGGTPPTVQSAAVFTPQQAWTIVKNAFADNQKPVNNQNQLLSDVGIETLGDFQTLLVAVNGEIWKLNNRYGIDYTIMYTWEKPKTTVAAVVASVEHPLLMSAAATS